VLEHAKRIVLETLAGMNRETRTDPAELKEEVRKSLRRYLEKPSTPSVCSLHHRNLKILCQARGKVAQSGNLGVIIASRLY